MKTQILALAATTFILAVLLTGVTTTVAASMLIPANSNAKENAQAPVNSPAIGNNWDLERVDFVHYSKPAATAASRAKSEPCYKLLGVNWRAPISYAINPANPYNLSETSVASAISTSVETWDAATSFELFNSAYGIDYAAQYGVRDSKNSVVFGDYPDNNVIAVTSIWYTRLGKQIVEFDMLFNTRFVWGEATGSVMDLQNIATHEFGHAAGLGDIYSSTCSAVTMYGYSGYGETQKRTLELPDVTGLQKMYGA